MDLFDIVISGKISREGGGGDISVDELNVTENGVYSASSGYAYNPVNVSVPTGVFPSGTSNITSNGMYDVTSFASASVAVPTGVFPSGTSSITTNGIYDITNFASVDVNVSGGGGGDHDVEDAIITRTLSGTYVNSRITDIPGYAFFWCSSLNSVAFENVVSIGYSAFQKCTSLTYISFPNLEYISNFAFQYTKLVSLIGPKLKGLAGTFSSMSTLMYVDLPLISVLGYSEFQQCSLLSVAKFSALSYISPHAFRLCSNLMSVYLLNESRVCQIAQSNVFLNTPIADSSYTGSFGSIYVPSALLSSYKTYIGWEYYSDRITAYEEE